MIDADGSGHLDLEEFKAALKTRANLSLEDDLMAAVWRSYDDNNNGVLDYRKFVRQVLQVPQYGSSNAQARTPPNDADLGGTDEGCCRQSRPTWLHQLAIGVLMLHGPGNRG